MALSKSTIDLTGDVLSQDGRGKNIVMTGGNRGIGWEALKMMLPLGYHVILGEFSKNRVTGTFKTCILSLQDAEIPTLWMRN